MKEIQSLIKSLTPDEWVCFQNYLTCFSIHGRNGNKLLKLATLLMDCQEGLGREYYCYQIYKKKRLRCFDELKSSLKERILDILLTDISTSKKKDLDEADLAIIKMKKRSAQFQQLLYSKNRNEIIYSLLDEIISLAKKYEQYSILSDHLRIKKSFTLIKKTKQDFNDINLQIDQYLHYNVMINKAEHYYHELIMLCEQPSSFSKENISEFFYKRLKEVEDSYIKTGSALIRYHMKFMELGYYGFCNEYSKCRSICLELLGIVRNFPSVYRRQRVGIVYDNLSRFDLMLGNYSQAAEWAQLAREFFSKGSENYCIALEQEFYAHIALKDYRAAIDTSNCMINSASRAELGEFRFFKYNILLAGAVFLNRNYSLALSILSQKLVITKDKPDWEFGARLLKIMTLIEMKKHDEAEKLVINLKQFTEYNKKKGISINNRQRTILNLLLTAVRFGFLFTSLNGNTTSNLDFLGRKDSEESWVPYSYEVIPFHIWFSGKMKIKSKKVLA